MYDPAQKRFLSPDPHVTDPLFGQNYNRYSYVLNNPLRFTDPTGFDPKLLPSVSGIIGQSTNGQDAGGVITFEDDSCLARAARAGGVQMSDDSGHNESVDNGLESTMTITVEDGTDEGRDHDRGMALMLARPTAVQLPGDNGVLFKAHGSRRDPKPVDQSLARDLASDAGEMVVRTGLCLKAGEAGCLFGDALYSGGTDVIEGAATGNGDEVREGYKRILEAVATQVLSEAVTGALDGIATSRAATINPTDIRFSQSSVNGVAEIEASMKANGWVGGPIDVVRMGDGSLTTFDNTRVLAASRAGIDVRAVVHDAGEAFPEGRLGKGGTQPQTWGEAIQNRIQGQNRGYRTRYPNGSAVTGSSQ